MVDQVETLLLNPSGVPGYRHVVDVSADSVMTLFGVAASDADGKAVVLRLLPLALAPDLARFRRFYDRRVTPRRGQSVYRQPVSALSPDGLRDRVLGHDGWWTVSGLFQHPDPGVAAVLSEMRAAAVSADAPYALGAVLLACAYRRWLLQGGGD